MIINDLYNNKKQGLAEDNKPKYTYPERKPPKHYDPDWIKKASKEKLDSIAGKRYPKKDVSEEQGPVTHRIGLTVTDPNHPMVSKRKEPYQKSIRITQNVSDREAAINQAIAHYRRKGYKVHDHHYIGTVDQGMAEAFANPGSGSTGTSRGAKRIANTVRKALVKNAELAAAQAATRKELEAQHDAQFRNKKQGMAEGSFKQTPGQQQYGALHSQLQSLANSGQINTPDGKQKAEKMIDTIQQLVDTDPSCAGSTVPSKKIWLSEQGMAEGKADPVGSWVVYDGGKVKRFKSHEGAKAYAEKNGGKVASGEYYADKIQKQGVAEASLGDYRKKATVNKAVAQANRFLDRDDAAKVAAADQTIAKREKGLARADARVKPYTPPKFDAEKHQRDLTAKYPNIDELVRRAELNRDPDYEMADGQAYYAARDAEQNYQKLRQIQRVIQGLNESLDRSHLP